MLIPELIRPFKERGKLTSLQLDLLAEKMVGTPIEMEGRINDIGKGGIRLTGIFLPGGYSSTYDYNHFFDLVVNNDSVRGILASLQREDAVRIAGIVQSVKTNGFLPQFAIEIQSLQKFTPVIKSSWW